MDRIVLLMDVGVVAAFVAIGRDTHDQSAALAGMVETGAPFLVALGVGWVAMRVWRKPTDLLSGAGVAAITVVLGMLLRRVVFDEGTAFAFILVASTFLGGAMVGWRALARRLVRRPAAV